MEGHTGRRRKTMREGIAMPPGDPDLGAVVKQQPQTARARALDHPHPRQIDDGASMDPNET